MKNLLLVVFVVFCGCAPDNFYYEDDFLFVYQKAQAQNKKLWVLFGGGKECTSCDYILREIKKNGLIKKYKNEYLFFKCDINQQNNKFMHYNLLMKEIPNSYIFDEKGV